MKKNRRLRRGSTRIRGGEEVEGKRKQKKKKNNKNKKTKTKIKNNRKSIHI